MQGGNYNRPGGYGDRSGAGFGDRGRGGGFGDRGRGGGYGDRGRGGGYGDRGRGGYGRGGGGFAPSNDIAAPKTLQLPSIKSKLAKVDFKDDSKTLDVLSRPDKGNTTDPEVQVTLNCFDIDFAEREFCMYDIEVLGFEVEGSDQPKGSGDRKLHPRDRQRFTAMIVHDLFKRHVYDSGRIVYSLDKLADVGDKGITREHRVPTLGGNGRFLVVSYKIRLVESVSTKTLNQFLRGEVKEIPQESLRLLDCVFRTLCGEHMENVGKHAFYSSKPIKTIDNRMFSIHQGFHLSTRPQWRIRINVDMTCRAFFPTGNLADILYGKYGDSMADVRRTGNQLETDLRGLRVEARFYKGRDGKPFVKRMSVCGLSKKAARDIVIQDLGQSVAEYYQHHHGIALQYPELPCASMSTRRDVFIPLELLFVLPFQPATASTSDIASEVIRCAAVRPEERFDRVRNFVNALAKQKSELANMMGLRVQESGTPAVARLLPQPTGLFGRGQTEVLRRGKWEARSFHTAAGKGTPVGWGVIALVPKMNPTRDIDKLLRDLPQAAERQGVRLDRPKIQANCGLGDLERILAGMQRDGCQFVVVILYDRLFYGQVKRLGDLSVGVVTQCVLGSTMMKPNVCPNLMLKINAKLGGINWSVPSMVPAAEEAGGIMVFGLDVTHPNAGGRREMQRSIAAVVGTMSPDLVKCAAIVRQQDTMLKGNTGTREIVDALEDSVRRLVEANGRQCNGRLPTRLMFYRDGVSEGQYSQVLAHELSAIQAACRSIRPDYEPAVTYITVQKRHHVRMLPARGGRNVLAGTVVDREVTGLFNFDFYLCSHEGIQGTSAPAHYCVLYDDCGWDSKALQLFSYCLCHVFQRCPRSVSLPAPTYYAHLAAFRARDWMAGADRSDRLFDPADPSCFALHQRQSQAMFFM